MIGSEKKHSSSHDDSYDNEYMREGGRDRAKSDTPTSHWLLRRVVIGYRPLSPTRSLLTARTLPLVTLTVNGVGRGGLDTRINHVLRVVRTLSRGNMGVGV